MARCCVNCFSDVALLAVIREFSDGVERCAFCSSGRGICVNPESLLDKLELLTYGLEEDATGLFLSDVLSEMYGVFSEGVRDKKALTAAIFGEDEANKRFKFVYPTNSYLRDWDAFKIEIKHLNRHFPQNEIYSSIFHSSSETRTRKVFFALLEQLKDPVHAGQVLFRARASEDRLQADEMGAPPREKASAGRANPPGISYLYLADNTVTAVAEVRPSNASTVSVAEFIVSRNLSVVDLTNPRALSSATSFEEDELEDFLSLMALLENFSEELSKPIHPDKADVDYVPTQFLCEFIKSVGKFDGIIFKSSFGFGKNYVFFQQEGMNVREVKAYSVKSSEHQLTEV